MRRNASMRGETRSPASGVQARYGYTGREPDETGLTYYRARYYDPTIGRFTQRDPIGLAGGINSYAYAGGNPVNFNDPSGLLAQQAWNSVSTYFGEKATNLGQSLANTAQYGMFKTDAQMDAWGAGLQNAQQSGSGAVADYLRADMPGMWMKDAAAIAVTAGGSTLSRSTTATLEELSSDTLAAKANQIHNVLDPIAQNQRTTAVLSTSGGDIAAGGVRDLTPAQRAVAEQLGATTAKLPGAHAEVTAIQNAEQQGFTPKLLETTRDICPACAAFIESVGGKLTGPRSAKW